VKDERLWRGGVAAWLVTIGVTTLAVGFSIEHPEYLSTPLWPFAVGMSVLIIGLPLALGLTTVQIPIFKKAIDQGLERGRAWTNSAFANAGYAALLTIPATFFAWLLVNEPSLTIRPIIKLMGCSIVTSLIWFVCNELFSRSPDA
jgi:hypothetical protein